MSEILISGVDPSLLPACSTPTERRSSNNGARSKLTAVPWIIYDTLRRALWCAAAASAAAAAADGEDNPFSGRLREKHYKPPRKEKKEKKKQATLEAVL